MTKATSLALWICKWWLSKYECVCVCNDKRELIHSLWSLSCNECMWDHRSQPKQILHSVYAPWPSSSSSKAPPASSNPSQSSSSSRWMAVFVAPLTNCNYFTRHDFGRVTRSISLESKQSQQNCFHKRYLKVNFLKTIYSYASFYIKKLTNCGTLKELFKM